MKAVVLAAGQSSRFWPLAQDKHKTFYRCGWGKTIIESTIASIGKDKAIDEIILVISEHDFLPAKNLFANNKKVHIVVQEQPTGEGDALLLCKEYLPHDELFFLTGGHKVNAYEILQLLKAVHTEAIAIRTTDQPQHYGIVTTDKSHNITSIVEKPPSELRETSLKISSAYILDPRYLEYLEKQPSDQYSLELALDLYIKDVPVKGVAIDAVPEVTLKFPWHLLAVNALLQEEKAGEKMIAKSVEIAKTAVISGPVFIDEGAKILEFAKIVGPVYIGKNVIVGDYATVRENCFIDDDVVVGSYTEIARSILYQGIHTHRNFIGDSIFGNDCKIGAGSVIANRRLDRKNVSSVVKGTKIISTMAYLGAIAGTNIKIGINASIMPGVKIGNNAHVWPNCVVMTDLPDNTVYQGGADK